MGFVINCHGSLILAFSNEITLNWSSNFDNKISSLDELLRSSLYFEITPGGRSKDFKLAFELFLWASKIPKVCTYNDSV